MNTTAPAAGRLSPPAGGTAFAALVRRGVLDRRRAPLTWGVSLGAMSALIVAMWPSIDESISKAVRSYPKGLKEAFGIDELNNVAAYLDAEMFSLIIPLAVSFFAVRVVVGMLASAEESGHLDTLLAAPISRRALAASAIATAGIASAAVLAVIGALAWVAGAISGSSLPLDRTAAAAVSVWALAMFFTGLAVLATGPLRRPGAVTAVATGTLVAMYVIDVLGRVAGGVESIRWASAFRYYGSALKDGLDPLACAGLTVAGLVMGVVGALLFERRDVL